jgi:hypothetical protein
MSDGRAEELEAAFRAGFEMPGYYSTGTAWYNSDMRPSYLEGENGTFLIVRAGASELVERRARPVEGRTLAPKEAYAAFAEGHRAGRTGELARRGCDVAWRNSESFGAAHPGVKLARGVAAADEGRRARAELRLLTVESGRLQHVRSELHRVSHERRDAGRKCGRALSEVFRDGTAVRAALDALPPDERERMLDALAQSPASFGQLRADWDSASLANAVDASRAFVTADVARQECIAWANHEVEGYRTARSYTAKQIAHAAERSFAVRVQRLENVLASPSVDGRAALAQWNLLPDAEKALARAEVQNVEALILDLHPDTAWLAADLNRCLEYNEISRIHNWARVLGEDADKVVEPTRQALTNLASAIERATAATGPLTRETETPLGHEGPEQLRIRAAALRSEEARPKRQKIKRPDQPPGETRAAAAALEALADAHERGTAVVEWAQRELGIAPIARSRSLAELSDSLIELDDWIGKHAESLKQQAAATTQEHAARWDELNVAGPPPTLTEIQRKIAAADPAAAELARKTYPVIGAVPHTSHPRHRPTRATREPGLSR